jgi:hypothetical protein
VSEESCRTTAPQTCKTRRTAGTLSSWRSWSTCWTRNRTQEPSSGFLLVSGSGVWFWGPPQSLFTGRAGAKTAALSGGSRHHGRQWTQQGQCPPPSPPEDQEAGHYDPDLLPLEHHCPSPSPPCSWLVLGSSVGSGGWWCCGGHRASDYPHC